MCMATSAKRAADWDWSCRVLSRHRVRAARQMMQGLRGKPDAIENMTCEQAAGIQIIFPGMLKKGRVRNLASLSLQLRNLVYSKTWTSVVR